MLSGVGAYATTESKHPGAAGYNNLDTGNSTETVVATFPAMRDGSYYKFWVYILTSQTGTLYIGITGHLAHRIHQHKIDSIEGFTKRYQVHRLVYFESYDQVESAISREKQLKGWRRDKKKALIEKTNPRWQDLAEQWGREMRFRGSLWGELPESAWPSTHPRDVSTPRRVCSRVSPLNMTGFEGFTKSKNHRGSNGRNCWIQLWCKNILTRCHVERSRSACDDGVETSRCSRL